MSDAVTAAETGNSSSRSTYGNLTTSGPTVTIDTTALGANAKALIFLTSEMAMAGDDGIAGRMSVEITGPAGFTTIAPDNARALAANIKGGTTAGRARATAVVPVTLGPAGSYTFTAKYRVTYSSLDTGKTVTFSNREIVVSVSP